MGRYDGTRITALGYPMTYPVVTVIPIDEPSDASLVVRFKNREACTLERREDVVVAHLKLEPLVARGMALRCHLDGDYLTARIIEEGLTRPATFVGLQSKYPAIPVDGPAMDSHLLRRHDLNNRPPRSETSAW